MITITRLEGPNEPHCRTWNGTEAFLGCQGGECGRESPAMIGPHRRRTALEEAGYILPPRTPMIMNAATAAKPAVANTDQRTGIARIRRAEAATHRARMNTDVVVVPLGISTRELQLTTGATFSTMKRLYSFGVLLARRPSGWAGRLPILDHLDLDLHCHVEQAGCLVQLVPASAQILKSRIRRC
jgi:hypothetical protein